MIVKIADIEFDPGKSASALSEVEFRQRIKEIREPRLFWGMPQYGFSVFEAAEDAKE